jgi:hypothetical protein
MVYPQGRRILNIPDIISKPAIVIFFFVPDKSRQVNLFSDTSNHTTVLSNKREMALIMVGHFHRMGQTV